MINNKTKSNKQIFFDIDRPSEDIKNFRAVEVMIFLALFLMSSVVAKSKEAESENIKIETSIERNKIRNSFRDYSIHDHCSIQLVCKNVNHIKPGTCHFT